MGQGNGGGVLRMAAKVPLLGQPMEVFEIVPMVVLRCKCQPGNPPITIRGFEARSTCTACGNRYLLAKVVYVAETRHCDVEIGWDRGEPAAAAE